VEFGTGTVGVHTVDTWAGDSFGRYRHSHVAQVWHIGGQVDLVQHGLVPSPQRTFTLGHETNIMRLSPVLTVALGAALLAACGGDNGPSNGAPTAAFTAPTCTVAVACAFSASGSTDDGTIAAYLWEFDDAASGDLNTATTSDASHTFATAGSYDVKLTVTDNDGLTGTVTHAVTVSTTAANIPPTADFTAVCNSLDCTFTNESTDEDGTFTSSWDFGDGSAASTETSPTHSYTVTQLDTFTVTLTVTDDGGLTNAKSVDVTPAPAATLTCGSTPDCVLTMDVPAKVLVTLVSSDCQLSGNTFKVTITPPGGGAPVEETLFTDGCDQTANPPGTTFQLQSDATFAAGTEITAQVISGGVTLELPPAIRVTGDFASGWTLEFDDGAQSEPPEPDFNDLVISVVATPQ
jgi:PKD repeat protein